MSKEVISPGGCPPKPCRRSLVALLGCLIAVAAPARAEEPLWGESASTLGQGFVDVMTYGDVQDSKPYLHHGGPVALTISRTDFVSSIEYGLQPDLDVHLRVPYFSETLKQSFAGQSISQPLTGLGEARLGAKWRFAQSINDRHKDELALLADLKLPTGLSHLREADGLEINPHLQPNSGNLGALLGIAANRHTARGGYWLSGMVSAEAASCRYQRGAMLELHASTGRRLRRLTRGDRPDWMGIAGLHFHWMGKDREAGRAVRDSGGSILSVEVGLIGSKRSHGARLGLLLPIRTDIGLAHPPPRQEIQASIHASF
jgi:hypothetical protein